MHLANLVTDLLLELKVPGDLNMHEVYLHTKEPKLCYQPFHYLK